MSESNKPVYAAIGADFGSAVSKFVAAGFTGSSGMLTEGIHSVIDTGITALMLMGSKRSAKPPDSEHPFGYSRELYYWTTVVALLLFSVGGGLSVYEGINRLIHPHTLESPYWNYGVLLVSACLSVYPFSVAYRQLRRSKPDQKIWRAIRTSKDPRNFSVLLVDTADLIGVAFAFIGVLLGQLLHSSYPDGIAALVIGLVLASVAVILANESRHLLVGESADREVVDDIRAIVEADPAVDRAHHPLTMQLGPEEVLLTLGIRFREALSAADVGEAMDRMQQAIREKRPEIKRIFLEVESLQLHRERSGAK
jgi:cation diffusion facilitator family transporter